MLHLTCAGALKQVPRGCPFTLLLRLSKETRSLLFISCRGSGVACIILVTQHPDRIHSAFVDNLTIKKIIFSEATRTS